MHLITRALHWMAAEAREKVDLRAKWAEIKEIGKVWGPRFVIFALLWELFEDAVCPTLTIYFGGIEYGWLAAVFLIWHFEPIAYPVALWCFRTYDRITGKTKWEADRPAYSSHKRSAIKVATYRVASLGGLVAFQLYLDLNPWILLVYVLLMTGFNFIHERIWHDTNFGIITETDEVQARRVVAKSLTYRTVSFLLLGGALAVSIDPTPWTALLTYQGVMWALYGSLETAWSKSTMGITGIPETPQNLDMLLHS